MVDDIFEVTGLGKGLGSIGAKISKSAGLPGLDISSGVKTVQPPQPKQDPDQEMTPEEQAAQEAELAPEVVEKLPKPQKIEYDKLGAPKKETLVGHIVRRDGKEYVLDWDAEFDVYKLVDPATLRVRTRVRPASISTVDFRAGTIREAIAEAITSIKSGTPVYSLVSKLLDG